MLNVRNLSVSYRGIRGLVSVSFTVPSGQLVGLIGPNGAGKSTLLKAMLGLIPVLNGTVQFQNQCLQGQRRRIAYMPQRSQIDWDYPITVWNVVMLGRVRHLNWFRSSSPSSRQIVRTALERVEMLDLRDRRLSDLSGGQQQRVFLARALAQEADLLLFDEPLTGVDQKTEAILLNIFSELRDQGKILLVSSHHWGSALSQCDRLLLLNQALIADGSPAEVLTSENWQRAYGVSLPEQTPKHLEAMFFC
uniref:ABC transporter related n=1 Tax=Cyanothece sp. (strain PCC 7425 / ATCC 29141) TaxID=395961 RepID=B8HW03_CYAP4